jgi:hypothetical protein
LAKAAAALVLLLLRLSSPKGSQAKGESGTPDRQSGENPIDECLGLQTPA